MTSHRERRTFLQTLLAGGAAAAAPALSARASSNRVFYGYPPGSIGALVAGIVLTGMQGRYQPDLGLDLAYMPGNTAARSIAAVHQAPADGGSVLYSPSTVLTLSSHIRSLPGVDVVADFVAVAPLVEFTFAFVIGPSVPPDVLTMQDFLRWVQDHPEQARYGLPGLGTAAHFTGMAIARNANTLLQPVAYQGLIPMTKDLTTGGVPAAIMVLHRNDLRSGAVRPLAVTSAQRWSSMPALPTLRELGLCDIDVTETFGFHVRSGTPPAKVQALGEAVQLATQSTQLQALVDGGLLRTVESTPRAYAEALRKERDVWAGIVKRERFRMDS